MDNILLSIIIPSFNQGDYIENAIQSILKQEYQNWELFIQDGNSTDQTESICNRYARFDPRIHFTSVPDKGFADAVNKALSKCSGVLVGIQSSDDFYATKDVFSEVVQIYRQYPPLMMIAGYALLIDSSFRQIMVPNNPQENGFIRPDTVYTLHNNFSQGAMFFSRERALLVNGLDSTVDMVADTDFWIRMANHQPVLLNKIFRTSQVWACVTIHEKQRSNYYNRFYLGRARMAMNHLRDNKIALDPKLKYQNALNLINAAFDYYCAIAIDTAEIEKLYKELTGERMSSKKALNNIIARFLRIRKAYHGNTKADSSMNNLSMYPSGDNLKWF